MHDARIDDPNIEQAAAREADIFGVDLELDAAILRMVKGGCGGGKKGKKKKK